MNPTKLEAEKIMRIRSYANHWRVDMTHLDDTILTSIYRAASAGEWYLVELWFKKVAPHD